MPALEAAPQSPASAFTIPLPSRLPPRLATLATRPLERWSGLRTLGRLYAGVAGRTGTPQEFFAQALAALEVQATVAPAELARVPASGPLVLVANHPFGAIEGVVLGHLLAQVRPDFKFMANFLLARIPELRPALIPVDPFGGAAAGQRNLGPMRACLAWLKQGGALAVFPAGEVAHLAAGRRRLQVADPAWNPNIAGLIRRSGAAVVPVHFAGRNSALFQTLGLVHARLRTALLPRELLNQRGATVAVRIGTPISAERLALVATDQEAVEYLRLRTNLLRTEPHHAGTTAPAPKRRPPSFPLLPRRTQPVAPADPPEWLRTELAALPPERCLVTTDEFTVHCAPAAEIPLILREIARLRELTFRAVGEGTGRALDLDRFDHDYLHLFVWHQGKGEIVGAYRLGQMDEIRRRRGPRGLYTRTLFRYPAALLQRLGPTLELGRSFVRPEWQRSFSPLLLLWKGIGRFVTANPQYRHLLGPVSISNDYRPLSRQLLAAFLRRHHWQAAGQPPVRARNNLRLKWLGDVDPRAAAPLLAGLDELSALVAQIEPDGKGVPVLLRQYLKLGGVILGLNLDPAFANTLDGLVLVDLAHSERRLLEKYLGKDGAAAFLAHHAPPSLRPAA
jgi:putative hemolysin